MNRFALVVTWTLPDDADLNAAEAAFRAIREQINTAVVEPAEHVTAHTGVSAELLDQAARAGHLTAQAERLQLQPGDTVVITLPGEETDYDADDMRKTSAAIFPDHHVVFIWDGSTVTTRPADPA